MQTTTTTAANLLATKNLGLTFLDLTTAQIDAAAAYARRVWTPGMTDRQKQMDYLSDAVGAALLEMYEKPLSWDGEKGAFYNFFSGVVFRKLNRMDKKAQKTADSYSNENPETGRAFNYAGPAAADNGMNLQALETTIDRVLTDREREILEFVIEGYSNTEISEAFSMTDGAVRKAISILRTKIKKAL